LFFLQYSSRFNLKRLSKRIGGLEFRAASDDNFDAFTTELPIQI